MPSEGKCTISNHQWQSDLKSVLSPQTSCMAVKSGALTYTQTGLCEIPTRQKYSCWHSASTFPKSSRVPMELSWEDSHYSLQFRRGCDYSGPTYKVVKVPMIMKLCYTKGPQANLSNWNNFPKPSLTKTLAQPHKSQNQDCNKQGPREIDQ